MILKTFKKFKEYSGEEQALLPMFKDDEDRQFAKDLYRKVVLNHDSNLAVIKQHTVNWDIERIAFIDHLILADQRYFSLVESGRLPQRMT